MGDVISLDDHRQWLADMDIYASMVAEEYEAVYHEAPEDSTARDTTTKLKQVSIKMTKNELLKNDSLEKIDYVYTTYVTEDCNDHLKKGWQLISVGTGMVEGDLCTQYVLGRRVSDNA